MLLRKGVHGSWEEVEETEWLVMTYVSSGVNSVGSTTNWGSKFDGSLSESILGL